MKLFGYHSVRECEERGLDRVITFYKLYNRKTFGMVIRLPMVIGCGIYQPLDREIVHGDWQVVGFFSVNFARRLPKFQAEFQMECMELSHRYPLERTEPSSVRVPRESVKDLLVVHDKKAVLDTMRQLDAAIELQIARSRV